MPNFKAEALADLCSPVEFDKQIPDSRSLETDNVQEKPFAEDPPPKTEGKLIDRGHGKIDDCQRQISDPKSPELEFQTKTEGKMIDGAKEIDRGQSKIDECDRQISDPQSPELEIMTDSDSDWDSDLDPGSEPDPEKPFHVRTKRGWRCFSNVDDAIEYAFDEDQDEETQGKQSVIDEGGSETSSKKSKKSRKRKRHEAKEKRKVESEVSLPFALAYMRRRQY